MGKEIVRELFVDELASVTGGKDCPDCDETPLRPSGVLSRPGFSKREPFHAPSLARTVSEAPLQPRGGAFSRPVPTRRSALSPSRSSTRSHAAAATPVHARRTTSPAIHMTAPAARCSSSE